MTLLIRTVAVAAFFVVAALVLQAATASSDLADAFVPAPADEAENFLEAIACRRWDVARGRLAIQSRDFPEPALRALHEASISPPRRLVTLELERSASRARVAAGFVRQDWEVLYELDLIHEKGCWRIVDARKLDPPPFDGPAARVHGRAR